MKYLLVFIIIISCLMACGKGHDAKATESEIDSIVINNVTGESSMRLEESSIKYFFKNTKFFADSCKFSVSGNSYEVYSLNNTPPLTGQLQIVSFDITKLTPSAYSLHEIKRIYSGAINFKTASLICCQGDTITLTCTNNTKIIHKVDHKRINELDSINLHKTYPPLKMVIPPSNGPSLYTR